MGALDFPHKYGLYGDGYRRPPHQDYAEQPAPADPRRAAHEDAKKRAGKLREMVLGALADAALTADEVAEKVGEQPLSIRPRMTELKASGEIVKTPLRRPNSSGKQATVWMLRP